MFFIFFFQAEDGIRDVAVTGVQTCALPICLPANRDTTRSEPSTRSRPPSSGSGERTCPRDLYEARPQLSPWGRPDRKSTRLNSSHGYISYAVFCLKKKRLEPSCPSCRASRP